MIDEYPTLETERLLLRPLEANDLAFVFRHFADPEVNRCLYDEEPVTTMEQARAIVGFYVPSAGRTCNRWILVRKTDAGAIGTCGFHRWDVRHHSCEVGYDLEPASWGQGYMTEALEAALWFGFKEMDLNRIEAVVSPENEASLRLLEKLGFAREGLMRDSLCRAGVYHDHWLLSLLRADWTRSQTRRRRWSDSIRSPHQGD